MKRSKKTDKPSTSNQENYIKDLLKAELPQKESQSLDADCQWNFALDKHYTWDKKARVVKKKKKQFLTRAERKKLNLLKLPKTDWNYDDLHTMRQLWKEYMRKNLDMQNKVPSTEDATWCNFNATLAKSEFIGADITVVRSTVPSTVGLTGTIVLETKASLQIVTPKSELKCLLKKPSVFSFHLDGMHFTIFGKHMIVRPSERSVKKIKTLMVPDLL